VISVIATTGYNDEILSSPDRRYKRFLLYLVDGYLDLSLKINDKKAFSWHVSFMTHRRSYSHDASSVSRVGNRQGKPWLG